MCFFKRPQHRLLCTLFPDMCHCLLNKLHTLQSILKTQCLLLCTKHDRVYGVIKALSGARNFIMLFLYTVASPSACLSSQSMMIMRLGVIKPLETRKFIVVSRQYLGSTEAEIVNLWKEVMVRRFNRLRVEGSHGA